MHTTIFVRLETYNTETKLAPAGNSGDLHSLVEAPIMRKR